jgi:hypothetical protein
VGEIVRTAMSLSTADPDDLGANSVLLERALKQHLKERRPWKSLSSICHLSPP